MRFVATALLLTALAACDENGAPPPTMALGPDVPRLDTPEWSAPGSIPAEPSLYPWILLRYDLEDGAKLLLKHKERAAVYLYDTDTRVLVLAPRDAWEKATGDIRDCSEPPFRPASEVLHKRPSSGSGLFTGDYPDDAELETIGEVALWFRSSPGGTKVAVLSADGRRKGTVWMPMISGGGATGQRYHEVRSLSDLTRIGPPSRLGVATDLAVVKICWTADECHIVYVAGDSSHVAIVHMKEDKGS